MRIVDIHWRNYRLPLISGFSTAHGVMTTREGIIVQVTGERGIVGIGEIAPLPAFGGGSLADAGALLLKLSARLCGKALHEALGLLHSEGGAGVGAAPAIPGTAPQPSAGWRSPCLMRLARPGMWGQCAALSSRVRCHEQP